MIREEQIIEAGIEYTMQNNPVCIGGDNFYEQAKEFNRNRSFEAGAKWADKTMVEKACKWLLRGGYFVNNAETIDDFKRAMEG